MNDEQKKQEEVPPEYRKIGVYFRPLEEYPTEIKVVENISEFFERYAGELDWCADVLERRSGYGIALPQIGVPVNASILRFNLNDKPVVMFNLKVTPDPTKARRKTIEVDYSIGYALLAMRRQRYAKITASWEDSSGHKHKKVFKSSAHDKLPSPCIIFQNIHEHFRPDYAQYIKKLLVKDSPKEDSNVQKEV